MTEQQLFTLLSTDSGISAITSNIFNGDLPESVSLPAVSIEYVSEVPINTFAGDSGATRKRYTINSWANTYSTAVALKVAIQTAMSANPRLGSVPLHEEDVGIYRFAVDYSLFN